MDKRFYKTEAKNAALEKVHIKTFSIAKTITPELRRGCTQGIPPLFYFRAFPPYRTPEANALRREVYKAVKQLRAKGT